MFAGAKSGRGGISGAFRGEVSKISAMLMAGNLSFTTVDYAPFPPPSPYDKGVPCGMWAALQVSQ
jgi:hypothetical protein